MQDDLEVTGISRSGRVRKKSSKLMDFESPDDIETKYRRMQMKSFGGREEPMQQDFQENLSLPTEEAGTASGSESDYYENTIENNDSIESDSSQSDEGSAQPSPVGVANSLYMMEKSNKKKLIVKDGRVVGRTKAQRKDKGKTRITAYMMWAKEARNELLRKHPDMDFSAISKRLGEMWANVNYNERYLWKRKAKRFAIQKEQQSNQAPNKIISNTQAGLQRAAGRPPRAGPGRPPSRPARPVGPSAPSAPPAPPADLAPQAAGGGGGGGGVSPVEVAAHLRLLGESLAIIGERLKEHEGQIAVSGSVSVLLDTLVCSLAPLVGVAALLLPAPPCLPRTLHNIAYIMPGL